jgi:site-specific recombinase XerD
MRHSWTLLSDYLTERGYTAADFVSKQNTNIKNDFEASTASLYTRNAWLSLCSHVSTLHQLFQPETERRTELIRRAVKRRTPGKQKKYKTMWDIGKLLRYISTKFSHNDDLTIDQLLNKMVVLVMIFTVSRFPEMTRLSVNLLSSSADRLTIVTEMKQTLDEQTPITLRPLDNASICPFSVVRAWLDRTGESGSPLFVDPVTHAPLKAQAIGKLVRRAFEGAGIPPIYGTYTIRHSVVSFLFGCGVEEWKINDFGRWAPGSHTSSTFYRVASRDDEWLGYKIAQAVIVRGKHRQKDVTEGGEARKPESGSLPE